MNRLRNPQNHNVDHDVIQSEKRNGVGGGEG